ncbi:uncharacterized protein LOC112567324 [Pomacea canaliculata]|nr:uncharacterized protein LOC112567324 [Pomacea canaliculata]XP_025099757.1 uncharacterized protein LOC112567324 [Pomacea canaliculata]XP_025099758.1 uncharacterized protein LOC112567324 [Pomacea canaliculata]XP_025099759.1 uncharacterized protein LOC112567324 [Pomacea canaliculata]
MEGKQALLREAGILREIIRRIIKDLDEAHKNINIANATASAISLIGGVMTVGGAILAIPTAGLSLSVAGAGALVAGAGGVVGLTASIVEHIIQKHNLYEVQQRWEQFQRDFAVHYTNQYGSEEVPLNILDIVGKIINDVMDVRRGYSLIKDGIAATRAVKAGRVGSKLATGVSKVGGMFRTGAMGGVASLGTKAVGKVFFVVNVVLIPVSLVDLVRSASAISSRKPSMASSKLEKMADFLDRVANDELYNHQNPRAPT